MSEKNHSQPPIWRTDIKDWRKLPKDAANFILAQAETALKETNDTAKSISARADKTVSILIPIAVALITYVFSNFDKILKLLPLTASLCTVVVLSSLYYCFKNFRKYEIRIPGEEPKKILTSAFIDKNLSADEKYLMLLINQCENLQLRLDKNESVNTARTRNNTISFNIIVYGLISSPVLGYLLSVFLERYF